MNKIIVIDYGMGNLRSVKKALERMNVDALITSDKNALLAADKLILPGVGHFSNGMKNLKDLGLTELLNKKVLLEKAPILGICLGMQLFTEFSEEGNCEGLGFFKAITLKFKFNEQPMKVPHIGWNSVEFEKGCFLDDPVYSNGSFYFVHSYHVVCEDKKDIIGTTNYGYSFSSAIQKDNIIGVQFHPEKSFQAGLSLLKKFCS